MGHIFEQLLGGPLRPQELPFFVAARTQAPCFARQSDDEFVPTARAASSGKTEFQDSTFEEPIHRVANNGSHVAESLFETFLIYKKKSLEMLSHRSIENGFLGLAASVEPF